MNADTAARTDCHIPADTARRFSGVARLYGTPALRTFQEARICVVGITDTLDLVVDCADGARSKAALISHCRGGRCAVITIGGTGGQCDPSKIRVDDLSRAVYDPLLARTRRELRRHHGFGNSGSMGVQCVYSSEQSRFPQPDGGIAAARTAPLDGSLHCGGLGSATHLTGSFAFTAVARVLDRLARNASTAVEPDTGPAFTG